jgi:hypothetical protein
MEFALEGHHPKKEEAMNKAQLEKKIAYLEFVHDQLETELVYVDGLLKSVGFPQGLDSAKEVALELLQTEEMGQERGNESEND